MGRKKKMADRLGRPEERQSLRDLMQVRDGAQPLLSRMDEVEQRRHETVSCASKRQHTTLAALRVCL